MALLDHPLPTHAPSALAQLSDETLAKLVAAGSDDAFAALDARYRTRLVRYARGVSPTEAEDAVQDAMMRALRALRGGRSDPDNISPWLHRIVRNCALDLLAARRRGGVAVELEDHLHPISEDAGAAVDRSLGIRRLVRDVDGLPHTQRSALLLRELEGRTYADIADELDVTVPAVKSLLVRARAGLKRAREAAVLFPVPLVARLQQALEPLTAAATPKVACIAVVAASTAPVVAPPTAETPPELAKATVAHVVPKAVAPAKASAAESPADLPPSVTSQSPQAPAGAASAGASEPLSADCADGYVDQPISAADARRALDALDEQSAAYGACREALLAAATRGDLGGEPAPEK